MESAGFIGFGSTFRNLPFTGHLTPFGKFQPPRIVGGAFSEGGPLPHDTSATPMSDLFRGGIP